MTEFKSLIITLFIFGGIIIILSENKMKQTDWQFCKFKKWPEINV